MLARGVSSETNVFVRLKLACAALDEPTAARPGSWPMAGVEPRRSRCPLVWLMAPQADPILEVAAIESRPSLTALPIRSEPDPSLRLPGQIRHGLPLPGVTTGEDP